MNKKLVEICRKCNQKKGKNVKMIILQSFLFPTIKKIIIIIIIIII